MIGGVVGGVSCPGRTAVCFGRFCHFRSSCRCSCLRACACASSLGTMTAPHKRTTQLPPPKRFHAPAATTRRGSDCTWSTIALSHPHMAPRSRKTTSMLPPVQPFASWTTPGWLNQTACTWLPPLLRSACLFRRLLCRIKVIGKRLPLGRPARHSISHTALSSSSLPTRLVPGL
jgi:hypothetical protein